MFTYLLRYGYLSVFASGVLLPTLIISIAVGKIGWTILSIVLLFGNLYFAYSSIKETIDKK